MDGNNRGLDIPRNHAMGRGADGGVFLVAGNVALENA